MTAWHLPWLEFSLVVPLLGAWVVRRNSDPEAAQVRCIGFAGVTFLATLGAWWDGLVHAANGAVKSSLLTRCFGAQTFIVDELNSPLLPLAALLYLLTVVATARTKIRRFSFASMLISESLLLATLSCQHSWTLIVLLIAGTIPPFWELRSRHQPTRVYLLHMVLFAVLLTTGRSLLSFGGPTCLSIGVILMVAAVLLRSGIVPVHGWMTDLFEHATFGTALLFFTPMVGAYAAVRLVLPIAPDWAMHGMAILSLITAVYAAGLALVQTEARRFFCYLLLSHSSLVLVGLETATPIGLTGSLCMWLSVGLALAGFGLCLRSLEARFDRLSLDKFHGLYDQMPLLATLFLLTGLASVGYPGTIGFVGAELLVEGAVRTYPFVGIAVVIAAALNGIAVLQVYFRLFTGGRHTSTISLRSLPAERVAILTLAVLILGGGLFPQPGVASRYAAAERLIQSRHSNLAAVREMQMVGRAETADEPATH